eukprot:g15332.t1
MQKLLELGRRYVFCVTPYAVELSSKDPQSEMLGASKKGRDTITRRCGNGGWPLADAFEKVPGKCLVSELLEKLESKRKERRRYLKRQVPCELLEKLENENLNSLANCSCKKVAEVLFPGAFFYKQIGTLIRKRRKKWHFSSDVTESKSVITIPHCPRVVP